MLATLTGLGLSAAAGLNAYIPLLVVGLLARHTELLTLPPAYAWLESPWVLGVVAVLLVAELVLDKIAVVDHLNDAVQSVVRPAVGGVIFAATAAAERLDGSAWMRDNPWAGVLLGVLVALLVHATKSSARPVVNASTLGVGTPAVSAAEDLTSLGLSLVAILAPVLVVIALVLLAAAVVLLLRRRRRRRQQGRPAAPV
jgi:Domain of unknown function (DUF4126)